MNLTQLEGRQDSDYKILKAKTYICTPDECIYIHIRGLFLEFYTMSTTYWKDVLIDKELTEQFRALIVFRGTCLE